MLLRELAHHPVEAEQVLAQAAALVVQSRRRRRVAAAERRGAHLGCHSTLYVPNARGWYARTPYVLYVGPWGQAALCVRYVPNAGGWYA